MSGWGRKVKNIKVISWLDNFLERKIEVINHYNVGSDLRSDPRNGIK
jgi:hypothetical protein